MRHLTFTLALLLSVYSLCAQFEFAPIGAVWHYTGREIFSPNTTFLRLESVGDTVVMNRPCRKLEGHFFFNMPHFGVLFLHQQGDSVLFYNPDLEDFELLYDFNAQPGFTWTHTKVYPLSMETATMQYRVDAVSTVVINGRTLRKLQVARSTESGFAPFADIVETIGSEYYLMYSFYLFAGPAFDATYPDGLRCYYDPAFGLYETGLAASCEALSADALTEPEGIRVFPNPVSDVLHIENLRPTALAFDLLDLHGRVLRSGLSVGIRTELSVEQLPAGVYQIVFREGIRLIGRVRVVVAR